jgi:hypothetical protein
MKITFDTRDALVRNATYRVLLEKGYRVKGAINHDTLETLIDAYKTSWDGFKFCDVVPGQRLVTAWFEQKGPFTAPQEVLNLPAIISVKLNNSYTAEIFKDRIQVGCQPISWDRIEEIVKLHAQIK